MNVVLVHPIHGAKVAINQQEVENDKKLGWTEYNSDTPVVVAEAPKRKYTRKATDQSIEQPNETPDFLASVSDESEGK
jgi:hypothetical protein